MSDLKRLSLGIPAVAGAVQIYMESEHSSSFYSVVLSPTDAIGFATKILMLGALASQEDTGMVSKITERIRWLLDDLAASDDLLAPERAPEELPPEPEPTIDLTAEERAEPWTGPAWAPLKVDSLEGYYTGWSGDGRTRPWRCHCGQEGRGGSGLGKHLATHAETDSPIEQRATEAAQDPRIDKLLAEITDTEVDEALAQPKRESKHRFGGEHRSVKEDTAFGGKRVYCECGWVTLPFDQRSDAREAFAAHLDEMETARKVA